jgi:glucosamine-6-phosphate deaminase
LETPEFSDVRIFRQPFQHTKGDELRQLPIKEAKENLPAMILGKFCGAVMQPVIQKVEELTIQTYSDLTTLIDSTVSQLHQYLQQKIAQQGQAVIILASGSSYVQFLKVFTAHQRIDWSKVTCFHLDEYLGLEAKHPASFQRYMQELVVDRVPLKQFHFLDSTTLQPMQECRRYGALLAAQSIDLCLLGIGDNGHIAFNDPLVADFSDPEPVKIVKLAEKSRQQQVDVGFFADVAQVPQYAMTLTIPSICRAEQIYCLATGQRKASIVKQFLQEPIAPHLPATILRRQSQATLLLDTAAASLF